MQFNLNLPTIIYTKATISDLVHNVVRRFLQQANRAEGGKKTWPSAQKSNETYLSSMTLQSPTTHKIRSSKRNRSPPQRPRIPSYCRKQSPKRMRSKPTNNNIIINEKKQHRKKRKKDRKHEGNEVAHHWYRATNVSSASSALWENWQSQ